VPDPLSKVFLAINKFKTKTKLQNCASYVLLMNVLHPCITLTAFHVIYHIVHSQRSMWFNQYYIHYVWCNSLISHYLSSMLQLLTVDRPSLSNETVTETMSVWSSSFRRSR